MEYVYLGYVCCTKYASPASFILYSTLYSILIQQHFNTLGSSCQSKMNPPFAMAMCVYNPYTQDLWITWSPEILSDQAPRPTSHVAASFFRRPFSRTCTLWGFTVMQLLQVWFGHRPCFVFYSNTFLWLMWIRRQFWCSYWKKGKLVKIFAGMVQIHRPLALPW